MVLKLIIAAAGLVVAAPSPAHAPAPQDTPRYSLERTEGGFVRLDRVTGQMSFCRLENNAGLVCRIAADERQAYEDKLSGLTARPNAFAGAAGKPSLAEKKMDAAGEISLVEFILKRMIHAAREVADTAEQERMTPPAKSP